MAENGFGSDVGSQENLAADPINFDIEEVRFKNTHPHNIKNLCAYFFKFHKSPVKNCSPSRPTIITTLLRLLYSHFCNQNNFETRMR